MRSCLRHAGSPYGLQVLTSIARRWVSVSIIGRRSASIVCLLQMASVEVGQFPRIFTSGFCIYGRARPVPTSPVLGISHKFSSYSHHRCFRPMWVWSRCGDLQILVGVPGVRIGSVAVDSHFHIKLCHYFWCSMSIPFPSNSPKRKLFCSQKKC